MRNWPKDRERLELLATGSAFTDADRGVIRAALLRLSALEGFREGVLRAFPGKQFPPIETFGASEMDS